MNTLSHVSLLALLALGVWNPLNAAEPANPRPNILIILADDLGFSDVGCYGSEIQTPHLDQLAADGMRLTRFYNAARCCPSRASLLTGLYPHQAGMGSMADQTIRLPSYQGYLNRESATIAELLGTAGYHTSIAGKWHVGDEPEHWPDQRGFQRSFAFIHGAGSFFDDDPYRNSEWPWSDGTIFSTRDGKITPYPNGTYATDLYTDYALEFIAEADSRNQPFFLYLAYTAPHWPLHALPEDIERYRGRYDAGWDVLRAERLERQQQLGLLPPGTALSSRDPSVPAWESLTAEEQQHQSQLMEVYAAMVDRMDQNIGRILEDLEARGLLHQTLIVFLSDNGAASADRVPYLHKRFSPDAPVGSPASFTAYGKGWAGVSNTPFRQFKAQLHEGGIASPFIAHLPGHIPAGSLNASLTHMVDLMPTCLELAGVDYPPTFGPHALTPLAGQSLVPVFQGAKVVRNSPVFFEHMGRQAVIRPPYKLVSLASDEWELYDYENDRIESSELTATADPSLLADLLFEYHQWANRAGVFPLRIVHQQTVRKSDKAH